ncbi:MAG TPA: GNAT family N-acetyltransferase [Pyrinomonadaceae bacterium]|nr:GNAT family N-acetyltransferase [Pyrinomonadaceae bacterium]
MELKLTTCTVRSWQWSDRDAIVRHANNKNVWLNLRDRFPHPYTLTDARHWLDSVVGLKPETNFAIAVVDEAVGGIGYTVQPDVGHRSAEIGYWLGEDFWGRGIATEALIAVTEHAFAANDDLCRLYAHVFAWNPASARVLEKAGYAFEGRLIKSVTKNGQTIDQLMYAAIREGD